MAFTGLAQQVFHRDFAVIENHLSRRRTLDAHLFLFGTNDQACKIFLDQKGSKKFLVDLGKHNEEFGKTAIGDELLGAVEDIMCAILA